MSLEPGQDPPIDRASAQRRDIRTARGGLSSEARHTLDVEFGILRDRHPQSGAIRLQPRIGVGFEVLPRIAPVIETVELQPGFQGLSEQGQFRCTGPLRGQGD